MRESSLERKLKNEVEKMGGAAMKFTSPGMAGVPDRLIVLPGGKIFFAEVKAPGERLRKLQLKRRKDLQKMGAAVYVIDSVEAIQEMVQEVIE